MKQQKVCDTQRGSMTIRGMKSVMLLCVVGTLLVSGCMSARVTTNLKPGMDSELKSPAGQFYVAGLKYANAKPLQNPADEQKTVADIERRLLPLVRKECTSRYPALFMDEASSFIPLGVEVRNTTTMHNGKMMAWELGTACLCGLIFPLPSDSDEDFDVRAGVWDGRDGMQGAPLQTSFRRENHVWVSILTPTALITIPGKSDFPKVSGTLFGIQNQMETYYQQIAQQIATALAQLVATKEPGYWVAPVGRESTPAALPSVPTTLPPPVEPATPF
jgi:hypothetical protein